MVFSHVVIRRPQCRHSRRRTSSAPSIGACINHAEMFAATPTALQAAVIIGLSWPAILHIHPLLRCKSESLSLGRVCAGRWSVPGKTRACRRSQYARLARAEARAPWHKLGHRTQHGANTGDRATLAGIEDDFVLLPPTTSVGSDCGEIELLDFFCVHSLPFICGQIGHFGHFLLYVRHCLLLPPLPPSFLSLFSRDEVHIGESVRSVRKCPVHHDFSIPWGGCCSWSLAASRERMS